MYDFNETDGDLEGYNAPYETQMIQRNVDGYNITVLGNGDISTLKEISNSIKIQKQHKSTKKRINEV